MAGSTTFDRVYVWEAPVRLYHWVNAAAIAVLVATGLVIGNPPALLSADEASASYWFGWVRFVHFTAGFVMACAFLIRVYWMFRGNQYARWSAFVPKDGASLRRQSREVWMVIKTDVLQLQKPALHFVGHNGLAALSYFAIFLLTVFQIVTGFALYAPMSGWWLPHAFVWVTPLFGGDASLRFWHHSAMWVFVLFTLIHLYLSIFHDVTEARGEISAMVSGVRFVERK